jgi:hypothetical protein
MICRRCHSAMVLDTFVDPAADCHPKCFQGWRCLMCGAIVDPVISRHQLLRPEPTRGRARGKEDLPRRRRGASRSRSDVKTRPYG